MSVTFDKMTLNQRITAVNIDCMRHKQFALFSGVICMGKSEVTDEIPTACTNGTDKLYGAKFISDMTRKQLRYLVLHENGHVAYKHCVLPEYHRLVEKHGNQLCNKAMDYVVNGLIEEMDPEFKFVERPTSIPPLVDDRFKNMSFPQVLKVLLDEQDEDGGGGGGGGQSFDEHEMSDDMSKDKLDKLTKDIDDALRQGELLARKLAGNGKGGRDVFGLASERDTDWRNALRDFISTIIQGDDQSRFCPPNKRLLASGFILPSHFTESVGDLVIACDTSGSMASYYGMLFGEIARICKDVAPESVRVLWWDTSVCGDQVFKPHEYDNITKLVKPVGGGGTEASCVAHYMAEHSIKPRAVVWLSDGYLFGDDPALSVPSLWGIVDNDSFVPSHGKVLRIKS